MTLKTIPFDAAEHLDSPEVISLFLQEAFSDGDAAHMADALGVVARAHGMTQLARDTGLSRPALYRALSAEGRPELPTLLAVLKALGLQLQVAPRERTRDAAA